MDNQKDMDEKKKQVHNYARYSSLGLQMAGTILIFSWLGYKIDHWLKMSFPWFAISFILLSSLGTMYYVFRELLKNK